MSFVKSFVRREFADTVMAPGAEPLLAGANPAQDPLHQLLLAERADWTLLSLMVCAAGATLVLALAGSLIG